jgi:hypothetical protein
MRTIRASELGTFLFCRRAWWYQSQGVASENQTDLARGSAFHRRHGRSVVLAGLLRSLGWLLLLAALVLLAVGITLQALH